MEDHATPYTGNGKAAEAPQPDEEPGASAATTAGGGDDRDAGGNPAHPNADGKKERSEGDTDDTDGTYHGMHWYAPDPKSGVLHADSDITPARYVVETSGPLSSAGRTRLHVTFDRSSDVPDIHDDRTPRALLGEYRSAEAAVDAAELHDFHFFRPLAAGCGAEPAFRGSRRREAVGREDLDILLHHAGPAVGEEAATSPDGRPFTRAASFMRASKTKLDQGPDGSFRVTLTVSADEIPLWFLEAPQRTTIMAGLVAMGPETDPDGAEHAKRVRAILSRANQRPAEESFQEFMVSKYDRWGLIRTAMRRTSDDVEQATAETLRRVVGVPSRGDLETNADARARFERIDREYYDDMARSARNWEAVHDRTGS